MVKKLLVIGLLTGTAHLSTVLVLKKLTSRIPVSDLTQIAELDAVFNLIIIVLALGLLSSAVRDIALQKDWKNYFIPAQKARFTLSLFFIPVSLYGFIDSNYFFLAFAPVFALHGDYALYGKGYAKLASLLAFARVFITSAVLFFAAFYFKESIVIAFAVTNILVYLISGIIISRTLRVQYFFSPEIKILAYYINSLYLGVVAFGYYFFGLGLIIVAGQFYKDSVIASAYIFIKAYIIYKGVLRIVVQAFISEMKDKEICLKIDNLCSIGGISLLIATLLFPRSTTAFIIDNGTTKVSDYPIYILGICGMYISPFISLTTTAMLEKKDKAYGALTIYAISISAALLIILSFMFNMPESILISLFIGEIICSIGLILILKIMPEIKKRLFFIVYHIPLLLIPFAFKYFYGDKTESLVFSLLFFLSISLYINRKRFLSQAIQV